MDKQTRIGIGACALGILTGIGSPLLGWVIAGPIMIASAAVTFWGFWPLREHLRSGRTARIPMKELMTIASKLGWDFSDNSLHLIDFQDAVRQGALDGHLKIWGKYQKWDDPRLMEREVLEPIPQDHWKEFFIDLISARDGKNLYAKSWEPELKSKGYSDLYVDKSEAAAWLKRDAAAFRGRVHYP